MASLGFVEAFRRFGAKLENPMWAVSALTEDGALVLSCWAHCFHRVDKTLHYIDCLSRWNGNELGNRLLRNHLEKAKAENLPVRMVVATAKDSSEVGRGDASKIEKKFHIGEGFTGSLIQFDGDNFVIEFAKS